jgi:hypothetical protein
MPIGKATDKVVGRRLLRCLVCTRTEEKTATELLNYCQSTWPRCCGEVMAYFTQIDPNLRSPNDTVPDLLLPPR